MRIGPAKACCLMALCLCAVAILIDRFVEESSPASTEQNSRQNAHDADGCGHGCSGCSGHGSSPFRLGEVTDAASDRLYTKIPEDHQRTPLVETDGELANWKGQVGGATRARKIGLSPDLLSGNPFEKGEVLTLNLFEDVSMDAVVTESFVNTNGTVTTTTRIAGTHYGRAVLAFTEDELRVKVSLPESNEIYAVHFNHQDGEHYALELDPAVVDQLKCGASEDAMVPAPLAAAGMAIEAPIESAGQPMIAHGEETALVVIDVMVVYPDNVVTSAGSEANVLNIAAQGIALTNDAHLSTDTGMYINLVHSARLTGYTDSGNHSTDLNRITLTSDGHMDAVHTWRDAYGADFVQMMHSLGGGRAWIPNFGPTSSGAPESAFGITGWESFDTYTTAHEIGHNMNLHHAKYQTENAGNPANPTGTDAAGWRWLPDGAGTAGFCSVMSYPIWPSEPTHTQVGLFSDPNITDRGEAAGHIDDANNARVLRAYKNIYANYRTRPLADDTILVEGPNGGETFTRGDTMEIRWNSKLLSPSNVKIELHRDGVFEREVASSTINDRIFFYTIPNDLPSSSLYKLRISVPGNGSIEDFSDVNFTITEAFYTENMDSDPGYTTTGDWEYGAPAGTNAGSFEGPDSAYTGTHIYDTNLAGGTTTTGHLTSTVIDCSNYEDVTLTFAEWFSVGSGYQANVEVSKDGSTWTQVVSTVGSSISYGWQIQSYDISTIADREHTVYVRWEHLNDGGGGNFSGMSVDDVVFTGVFAATEPSIGTSVTSLAQNASTGSSPADQSFTVRNKAVGTLNYSITTNQAWLSVSPSSGSSTGEEDTITVSYSTAALGVGTYNANITISDGAASNSPVTIPVSLTVIDPVLYYASMDSDPGWTLDTGWGYGTPTAANQDGRGTPGPGSGYDGPNVIGYALSGDYEINIPTTRWATTPAIDCSGQENVTLTFQRWLGVQGGFDHAYIEVSNNGSTWTQVWQNSTTLGDDLDDSSWIEVQYDISDVADDKSTVYIRWGMGETNGSKNYCGWNIDEVLVNGDPMPSAYQTWSGGLDPNLDSNGDGIDNSVAWVLGASGPNVNATALKPVIDNTSNDTHLIFTYRRTAAANNDSNTTIGVEYGSDLSDWTPAIDDAGDDINITETPNFYDTGIDRVQVEINRSLAEGGKLFSRLKVDVSN